MSFVLQQSLKDVHSSVANISSNDTRQVLNAYCDDLASGRLLTEARLAFFVRGDSGNGAPADASASSAVTADTEGLRRIEALLPATGSLVPLLHAFGLLSDAELQQLSTREASAGDFDSTASIVKLSAGPGLVPWVLVALRAVRQQVSLRVCRLQQAAKTSIW